MKLTEVFQKTPRTYSFEFYPPKDEISAVDFGINVGQLMKLTPSFVSVTYGAGGSDQNRTFDLVDYLQNKVGISTVAHYTCIGANRDKALADLKDLRARGLQNFMLLRGDPKKGCDKYEAVPDGFDHASDLIAFARQHIENCCIGGGAYPEVHPDAADAADDIKHLRQKVDAGCDFLVTQLFFDNKRYFDFVARARAAGIYCRIIPGIIPLTQYAQMERFVKLSNTAIPVYFAEQLETYKDNPEKIRQIGMDFAVQQCRDLLMMGAPGLHFFTLNKSRATVEIYQTLLGR